MGCACTTTDQFEAEIDRHMRIQDKVDRHLRKLLLLGSGSSGKSTLFQQLRCIYHGGLPEAEFENCQHTIRQNVVMGMITLLRKSQEIYESDTQKYSKLLVNIDDRKISSAVQLVVEFATETFNNVLPPLEKMKALGDAIGFLWDLEPIQATFANRGGKFSLPDNMDYFFNKSELLYLEDYEPTREDALKTRIRTVSIISREFEIKDNWFQIVDVGGQRNERKKWISQFDNVTAVIFVAALNHYNAVLFEDEEKNAMHESIELFDEICNSKWFRNTEMILFLNKEDLFREMLREGHSLKQCFHVEQGWKGDQWDAANPDHHDEWEVVEYEKKDDIQSDNEHFDFCCRQCIAFIRQQYKVRNKNLNKLVFIHVTTATNRDNIEKVFWDVQNMVIRSGLKHGGVM
eukprot:CAMPEP_0197038034 /NCGR_PEP_ID=MMETSP1384-20130603/15085_1 /TAXON_ID=29189 /ORGANISM="Ammonia sp." /LENGTH=402 /DNA_ID=CAMNT_0042468427 /DNA_START=15 /DNA_END=1223 /DNA_ORIENTATION=-